MPNNDSKIIRGTGIQIIIISLLTLTATVFGIAGSILFIIEGTYIYLLPALFMVATCLYEFIHYVFYSSKISFIDSKFIM